MPLRSGLVEVNRQARRLAGLAIAENAEEAARRREAEDPAAKADRLRRQMSKAFMSGLTKDRRLAIADRGRRCRGDGAEEQSAAAGSGAGTIALVRGEPAADLDVSRWLGEQGRRQAGAEQVGFLTVAKVFYNA